MDEILSDFLTETGEQLDRLDAKLVRFERQSDDAEMLNAIFRLAHTVKGTCGFLGLDRLAKLAHGAESLLSQYRDGAVVSVEGVSAILASIDRIKDIIAGLERDGVEPPGNDDDLLGPLQDLAKVGALTRAKAAEAVPQASPGTKPSESQIAEPKLPQRKPKPPLAEPKPPLAEPKPLQAKPKPLQAKPNAPPAEHKAPLEALVGASVSGNTTTPASIAANAADAVRDAGLKEALPRSRTVRVAVETLERLMTSVSELVLTRNQFVDLVRCTEQNDFESPLQRLSQVTAELQDGVMKARMQPVSIAWRGFTRLVREMSLRLGKTIQLDMTGGETELDRQILEVIRDPLTHMIRNAADHGLETPDERKSAGKPEQGQIRLSASQEGAYIVMRVSDDGRGLNVQDVRAKAVENGLVSATEIDRMSDADVLEFIFEPGFSTAGTVSDISGRGVGMDVVRSNVENIGGTVQLASTSPNGTIFSVKIPLTLAIMRALIIEVAGTRFAVPQCSVLEMVSTGDATGHRIEAVNGAGLVRLRDQLLQIIDAAPALGLGERDAGPDRLNRSGVTAMIMQAGGARFGMLVDTVFHTEDIVVKPMPRVLRHLGVFCGNAILGDGRVILILDPNALALEARAADAEAGCGPATLQDGALEDGALGARAREEGRTALLLFRAGAGALKAVPLSLITRLEELAPGTVEQCNGQHVVQYRGALMPLVPLCADAPPHDAPQPVLVFTESGRYAGIMVDEIADIVEAALSIDISAGAPGVLGAAIVQDETVEIVDISHYLGPVFGACQGAGPDAARRLLLVDDSAFFRNMLEPLLSAAGYRVTPAGSGEEALALMDKGERYDAVVCDIEMPGLGGLDLAKRLKAGSGWAEVPLIALSSHPNARETDACKAAGFDSQVGKFDRQTLLQALQVCGMERRAAS